MVKKKNKIDIQQSKMYLGADICSDNNTVIMKYKLQCKKKIYRSTLINSKWTVSKLKKIRKKEEYSNRVKQNMNYTGTETTDTNQQCENLKHVIITAARDTGEFKATT
jgi:predicted metal-dependent hydrolase